MKEIGKAQGNYVTSKAAEEAMNSHPNLDHAPHCHVIDEEELPHQQGTQSGAYGKNADSAPYNNVSELDKAKVTNRIDV